MSTKRELLDIIEKLESIKGLLDDCKDGNDSKYNALIEKCNYDEEKAAKLQDIIDQCNDFHEDVQSIIDAIQDYIDEQL